MKKLLYISSLFVLPLMAAAQPGKSPDNGDNVKVDNRKVKEKKDEGPLNNAAIRKSEKKNAKEGKEWDKKKYKKDFRHKSKNKNENKKEEKEDKKAKKEEKKAL